VVALYDFGDRAGRNDALAAAFTTYRRALAAAWHALNFGSTERAPCDLGIALRKLGERRHLAFCEEGRLKVTRGHSARRYAVGGAC
jgi:hypothetical protein